MNERTVIITNTSEQTIGFADLHERKYIIKPGSRIRISKTILQDLLDGPGNKIIFMEGMATIEGVSETFLYSAGLTEEEIKKLMGYPVEEEITIVAEEETVEVVEEEVAKEEVSLVSEEVDTETAVSVEEDDVVFPETPKKSTPRKKRQTKKDE
jgi:hypothetical protein